MMTEYPKRLALGKMFRGTGYKGCLNTGVTPCILHSKILKDHKSLNHKCYRFVVGPQSYLHDAVMDYLTGHINTQSTERAGHKIKFFKTYKSAKSFHDKEMQKVYEFNKK